MSALLRFAFVAVIVFGAANAKADRIRVAVQKTGTLAWELDVIRWHGIDRKLDLIIDTLELASTEAGKVALKGSSISSSPTGCGLLASARLATHSCFILLPARSAR